VLSLVLPLLSVFGLFLFLVTLGQAKGGGFAVLEASALGIISIAIGSGLGAIATIVAVLRKERWVALQVVAFLLNFGFGLPLIVGLLRP
jgi:hypothetical protein